MLAVILLFAPAVRAAFPSLNETFRAYEANGLTYSAILRSHTTTTMYSPPHHPYSQSFATAAAGPLSGAGGGGALPRPPGGPGEGGGRETAVLGDEILRVDVPLQCDAFSGVPGQADSAAAGGVGEAGGRTPRFASRLLGTLRRLLPVRAPARAPRKAPSENDVFMQRIYVEALDEADNVVYSAILTKEAISLCAIAQSGLDPEMRQAGEANGVLNRDRRDALGFWRRQEYNAKSLLREDQGFPRQATFFDSSEILRAGTSYTERCEIPFTILRSLADSVTRPLVYRLKVLALDEQQQWANVTVPVEVAQLPVTRKNVPSVRGRDYLGTQTDESIDSRTFYSTFPLLTRTGDGAYGVVHQVMLEVNLFPCTLLDGTTKSYCAGVPVARVYYDDISEQVSDTATASRLMYPMPRTRVTLNAEMLNARRPYAISGTMESLFMIVSHSSNYFRYEFPTFEVIILAACLLVALALGLFKSIRSSSGGVFSTFQGFLICFNSLIGGAAAAFCISMLVFAIAYLFARKWLVGSGMLTENPLYFTLASGAGLSAFHYLFSRILQVYPVFSIVDWEGGRSASSILDTVNDERGMGGSSLWRREQLIQMVRELYRHRDVPFSKVVLLAFFILVGYDMIYQAVPTMQFSMTIGELDKWYTYLVFFLACMFSFLGLKLIYFVLNFFKKNPVERLGDYLSLLNCSLFVFEGPCSGFYIHGRAPFGTVEVPLDAVTDGLQREARGLLPRRGLKQGTSLQYFRFYFRPNTTPTTTFLGRVVLRFAEIASPDPHVTQQLSDEDFNGLTNGEVSVFNSRPRLTVSTFSRQRLLKLNDVERGLENLATSVLAVLPVTYTPLYHSLFNIPAFAKTRSAGAGKDILLVADPVETRRKRDNGVKPPGGLGLTPWLGWVFPFRLELKEAVMGSFISCALAWELGSPVLGAGVACFLLFAIDFLVTFFWERKLCESTLTRRNSFL